MPQVCDAITTSLDEYVKYASCLFNPKPDQEIEPQKNHLKRLKKFIILNLKMELTISGFLAAFMSAVYQYYPESISPSSNIVNTPQASVKIMYDFVIVGAGSAGCVLANRLTENKNWNVLLIEAGSDDNALSEAPLLFPYLHNSDFDWNYTTVHQKKACLSEKGICPYPRGHVMGGSSTTNAMYYVRGNKADYNDWAIRGNAGWSYDDVLPYFIKSENNTEPSLAQSFFHGTKGPLNIQYSRYFTSFREAYIKAAEEFGWKRGDYNGEYQNVAGYLQSTINGPSRESTAKAYLIPIRNRKNFKVIKKSIVTKIIIRNKIAKGVEYYREGKKYSVFAKKEVILSAGSINTPKILMLSGIGPKEELEKHYIKVKANLPVGKNLQDHLMVVVLFQIQHRNFTNNQWKTKYNSIDEYTKERIGPLTTSGAEAMAYFNTNNKSEPPNMQFTFLSIPPRTFLIPNRTLIGVILSNVKPKSVGCVSLKSADWNDMPLINPNYFSNKNDFEVFQKGAEYLFKYIETDTMSRLLPTLYSEGYPLCNEKIKKDFIDCIISQYSRTIYHPIGTAKMGIDKESVVNPNLQVYGIKNLRVIDASIMPDIPRGNTNAPTIMIAEKGSDIIKTYYTKDIYQNFN